MSLDPQTIETILYFKALFDLQHVDTERHKLDPAWRRLWLHVCMQVKVDASHKPSASLIDHIIDLVQRDREQYMCDISDPKSRVPLADAEWYWEIHCGQMYSITTDQWTQSQFWREVDKQKERHDRWTKSFRWREISLQGPREEPRVWGFGEVLATAEHKESMIDSLGDIGPVIKEEITVHPSVEKSSSEDRILMPPRVSVEPIHHGADRSTNELHQLSDMRLTDEVVKGEPLRRSEERKLDLQLRQSSQDLFPTDSLQGYGRCSPCVKIEPLENWSVASAA